MYYRSLLIFLALLASAALPAAAQAYVVDSYRYGAAAAGDGSLKDVVSSAVFDLDATKSASYGGSGQTWSNLVTEPADGSDQTAYDFYLGGTGSATTDDPTFTGGAGSSGAYFYFDGGDYFQIAGGMPEFLKSLHKTTGGQASTVAVAGRLTTGGTFYLFNTGTSSGAHGLRRSWVTTNSTFGGQQFAGSGSTAQEISERYFQTGLDYLVISSYDPATSTFYWWINGVRQGDDTITPNTSTTDSTNCRIGSTTATTPGGLILDGNRIYAVSGFNAVISDAEEALIRGEYESRHGRSYTRSQDTLADAVTGAGVVFQVDSYLYDSVFKSGTFNNDWSNVIASPAVGAQADYDFADTSTPPFVNFGSANGPYWNPSSGDYWQATADPQFFKDMHKTTGGTDFWVVMIVKTDGTIGSTAALFTTTSAAALGYDGVHIRSTTDEDVQAQQNGTLTTTGFVDVIPNSGLTGAWHFIALSYSHDDNNWRSAIDTTTFSDVSQTFVSSVLDAVGLATIGAESDGGLSAGTEVDWAAVAGGNSYIGSSTLAEMLYYWEVLHNRDYDGDSTIGEP